LSGGSMVLPCRFRRGASTISRRLLGVTSGCVSDALRKAGLKPHLVRTYKVSRDPEFYPLFVDVRDGEMHRRYGLMQVRGGDEALAAGT